jgi:hypothetical protein
MAQASVKKNSYLASADEDENFFFVADAPGK